MIEGKNWLIDWHNDWSQLWEWCNWYDFNVAWISFENDKIMGGYEVTFILFGLGFRWRWNHTETEQMREVQEAMEDIKAGTAKTVPFRGSRPSNPLIDDCPEAYIHREVDGGEAE